MLRIVEGPLYISTFMENVLKNIYFLQSKSERFYSTEQLVKFFFPTKNMYVEEMQWMGVVGHYTMVFRVRACQNVRLILSAFAGNAKISASEIIIGAYNNQRYEICQSVWLHI